MRGLTDRLAVTVIAELVDIANNAIWQYRDMYLRPDFYINNIERVQTIIAPVIEDYKSGKITYTEAEFNARISIYQSVNPVFTLMWSLQKIFAIVIYRQLTVVCL